MLLRHFSLYHPSLVSYKSVTQFSLPVCEKEISAKKKKNDGSYPLSHSLRYFCYILTDLPLIPHISASFTKIESPLHCEGNQ